jgi:hypothetical protein
VKSHRGTVKPPVPHRRLPSKVVSRQRLARLVLHVLVIALFLLLLSVTPVSSARPGAWRSRFFVVILDVMSGRSSFCGDASWFLASWPVVVPCFVFVFFLLYFFSFVFELSSLACLFVIVTLLIKYVLRCLKK